MAAGDFNADGRADLAFGRDTATSPAVPSALVWLNAAGAGSQLNAAAELGAAATSGVLVKDFNLDGRTDVLAMSSSGERIFTNAGAATFVLHPLQLATPGGRGVTAGRFSNDERIDIVVVGDGIGVFVNDGNGNFGSGDTTPPTLTLRGAPSVTLMIDSPYTDAGATATDTTDGDLTSRIVVVNPVNTALIGTATITYSVTRPVRQRRDARDADGDRASATPGRRWRRRRARQRNRAGLAARGVERAVTPRGAGAASAPSRVIGFARGRAICYRRRHGERRETQL